MRASRWPPCPERSRAFLCPGTPNRAPQTGSLHNRVFSLRREVGSRGVGRTGPPPEAPGEGPSRLSQLLVAQPPPARLCLCLHVASLLHVSALVLFFGRFTCPALL